MTKYRLLIRSSTYGFGQCLAVWLAVTQAPEPQQHKELYDVGTEQDTTCTDARSCFRIGRRSRGEPPLPSYSYRRRYRRRWKRPGDRWRGAVGVYIYIYSLSPHPTAGIDYILQPEVPVPPRLVSVARLLRCMHLRCTGTYFYIQRKHQRKFPVENGSPSRQNLAHLRWIIDFQLMM